MISRKLFKILTCLPWWGTHCFIHGFVSHYLQQNGITTSQKPISEVRLINIKNALRDYNKKTMDTDAIREDILRNYTSDVAASAPTGRVVQDSGEPKHTITTSGSNAPTETLTPGSVQRIEVQNQREKRNIKDMNRGLRVMFGSLIVSPNNQSNMTIVLTKSIEVLSTKILRLNSSDSSPPLWAVGGFRARHCAHSFRLLAEYFASAICPASGNGMAKVEARMARISVHVSEAYQ
jgi:hypothetical protein